MQVILMLVFIDYCFTTMKMKQTSSCRYEFYMSDKSTKYFYTHTFKKL